MEDGQKNNAYASNLDPLSSIIHPRPSIFFAYSAFFAVKPFFVLRPRARFIVPLHDVCALCGQLRFPTSPLSLSVKNSLACIGNNTPRSKSSSLFASGPRSLIALSQSAGSAISPERRE